MAGPAPAGEITPPEEAGRFAGAGDTVISGAAAAFTSQLALYGSGFVTGILITRAVGAEGRGEYYLPIVAASVCVTIASIGLDAANTIHRAEQKRTLAELSRNAGALAIALSPPAVIVMVVVFLLARSSVFGGVSTEEYLIAAATVPLALHTLWLTNIFVLGRRLARSQLALALGAILQLVAVLVLSLAGALDVTAALVVYAAMTLVAWLLHLRWARAVAPVAPRFDPALMRSVAVLGLKFQGGLLLVFLLLRFDIFFVSVLLGTAEVGIYSLAVTFAELTWILTNPLAQAAIPFQASVSTQESAPLAFKAARFNLAIGLLLSALFAATLWFVIPLLYGDEFSGAYAACMALMPGVLAMAVARPVTLLVARQRRPLLYSAIALGAFTLNGSLNIVLLPAVGIIGASVASSLAYTLLAVVLVTWSMRAGRISAYDAFRPHPGDLETVRQLVTRLALRLPLRRERADA